MQKSTSLTETYLAGGTTNVKQDSKNKKAKKDKKPKIIAVAPNLYLKITKKGKKRWVLSTYRKKKKHVRVIGDVTVMPQAEAKAIVSDAMRHLRLGKSKHLFLPLMRVFGELLNLQWSFYRDGHLHLPDSKTGPKIVYLSTPARQILDSLPRGQSKWIFPGPGHGKPLPEVSLWYYKIRKQAGLNHVRLHGLRHSFASHAVMRGVPLPVVSRLLGHSRLSMTMRYAHVSDELVESAAEKVGSVLIAEYLEVSS